MKRTLLAALAICLSMLCTRSFADDNPWTSTTDPDQAPVPKWIWGKDDAKPNEVLEFRTTFDAGLPAKNMAENPSTAALWVAGDDNIVVFLNGKQIGKASRSTGDSGATLIDVRALLSPGKNVLAIRCTNIEGPAAIAAKLVVRGSYRDTFTLITDDHWKYSEAAVPKWITKNFDDSSYPNARVLGDYGMQPWGKLPAATPANQSTPVANLTLLPGFKAELLYSVPKPDQGSWVAMTPDPKGRLYVSDQNGSLYRVTPGPTPADTKVEKVDLKIGSAQGLLWANDSLYVDINGSYEGRNAGIYRVRDTNHDDKLDTIDPPLVLLKTRDGNNPAGGEHGPHAVIKGPDGKLYFVAGNFTSHPEPLSPSSPAQHWAEDLLLPREPDGRGHDPTIWAPGGCVSRMNPDGSDIEAFAIGLRNTYDIAFNPDGELFGYDSDMEWDVGTPWYRPTRVNHIVSGAEFGWRNGSGKWPTYYPDSLPAIVDTALGSPTGIVFGTDAKFPAEYQHVLFANDWAYGRVFAVHIKEKGSSYSATYEPFITGKPFDVTDIVINTDGAMYITIGGRGTQSGLYRITYTGPESTAKVPAPHDPAAAAARMLRHHLEAYQSHYDPIAVTFSWPYLNSTDRFIRYAARVAIESQPLAEWQDRALAANPPTASINALLALSRVGDKSLQPKILDALDRLGFKQLTRDQKLELLRTYDVCLIRMGDPDAATRDRLISHFDPFFPSHDQDLDHELSQLLVYLNSPTVVSKCMKLMSASDTQQEQMFYALILRTIKVGWTLPQRQTYFAWYNMAEEKYTGGASFKLFLQHMRTNAIKTLTPEEMTSLASVLSPAKTSTATLSAPSRPFVRNWTMDDLTPKLPLLDSGRSFAKGKAAFDAVSCIKCHKFGSDGGSVGPDITGVGSRFAPRDILESIILPSKVISDQYRETRFVTKHNGILLGTIQSEKGDSVVIRSNPLSPVDITIPKSDITRRSPSKLSTMPTGLLNVLHEDEILDLLAYLRAAGNPHDKAFKN
ncbi:MAG TPA: hypothetical protein VFE58_07980 [Tepidisphaeraceae bacterium]|jgi:putative heme-binding domain-containing protein|nr:hypothetical protein [Tepidisphaeraceae bacterium]